MRAPAAPASAIAWEFWRRHRWGLIALTAYLIVLAMIKLIMHLRGQTVSFESPLNFALAVMVPLATTFTYFLSVFTYGLSGDLGARQSMYPARMLTLPVSTPSLAGWPMLWGGLAMALLWLATRFLAVWPSGFDIPVLWPAVLAAALLCWTQALTWMPYGLPGLRMIVTVLSLGVVDTTALLALHFNAHEPLMLAIVTPQIPVAYLLARYAVARARRGDVPDWRRFVARRERVSRSRISGPRRFASAARAQAWFEWRRHGLSLPVWVAILLPFELALLWTARGATALVFTILFVVLITPPFMAAFVAAGLRKASTNSGDAYGLTPFIATRPLTSAALIAAKLKMTIASTIAAWLLVLVATPAALILSDTWPLVRDEARRGAQIMGSPRNTVVSLLIVLAFLASTWRQLVQTLYIGLSGREWLARASLILTLAVLCMLGPVSDWILNSRDVQAKMWDAIPSTLTVLVAVKMSISAWLATRLYESPLVSDRVLLTGAALWSATVLAIYGVLAWIVGTDIFPRYLLALTAILAVPLARLSAAPLALAWNRHR